MRSIVFVLAWAACSSVVLAGEEKAPAKKPPPPPGIHWARDFDAGRKRALREGRPLLFAINALETEAANNRLAHEAYRSRAWGEATRGYVAFVCNPNDHGQDAGTPCTRYPGHVCAAHKAALLWFTRRFGENLISPQHVILEPDGDLAYRKEYYTGVVGPDLLDDWLSRLAPRRAYTRAGIVRAEQIRRFAGLALELFDGEATGYLAGRDGHAAAVLLNVMDDSLDGQRRLAVIRALRATRAPQIPVLQLAAEERVLYPDDEPEETLRWIETLFAADREAGVWAATRALVRLEDAADRERVLRLWAGRGAEEDAPGIDDLPATERAHAYEALVLAGDARARATDVPDAWRRGREREIRRALARAGRTTPGAASLEGVADTSPGDQRALLLAASAAEVGRHAQVVRALLVGSESVRVRVAAALALLGARLPHQGWVARAVLDALADPIEGPEARRRAVRLLGEDPGMSAESWSQALAAHLKGGAR